MTLGAGLRGLAMGRDAGNRRRGLGRITRPITQPAALSPCGARPRLPVSALRRILAEAISINDTSPTFTRASGAFDPYTSKAVPHNLLKYSEALASGDSGAAWTNYKCAAAVAGAITPPAGVSTVYKITETADLFSHATLQDFTQAASAIQYTYSVYLQAAERTWAVVSIASSDYANSRGMSFNLGTGAKGTAVGGGTATLDASGIVDCGGGWYRCWITVTTSNQTGQKVHVYLSTADTVTTYTGDGTSGLYACGAQLVRWGNFSDYVKTTSAAIACDVLRTRPIQLAGRTLNAALITGSRTNLCPYSCEMAASNYYSVSFSSDVALAPDGTMTADLITEGPAGDGNAIHAIWKSFTKAASSLPYSYSCYVKANGRQYVLVQCNDATSSNYAGAFFDVVNGVVGVDRVGGTGWAITSKKIEPVGNGWYRCCISVTSDASTGILGCCYMSSNGSGVQWVGDGVSGQYMWGRQLEQAAFPSPFNATAGNNTATSAVDALTCTLTGLVDPQGRTNYFTYSQAFGNAAWTKRGTCSITSTTVVAPDGTATACLVEGLNGPSNDMYQSGKTIATDVAARVSVWVKRVSISGTLTIQSPGFESRGKWSVDLALLSDGWEKLTATHPAVTVVYAFTGSGTSNNGLYFLAGSGGPLSFNVWGALLNLAASPDGYLPTGAYSFTSAPTGLAIDQGTILAVAIPYGWGPTPVSNCHIWRANPVASDCRMIWTGTTNWNANHDNMTGVHAAVMSVPFASGSLSVLAETYDQAGNKSYVGGKLATSTASEANPWDSMTAITPGWDSNTANREFYGWVLILYWPRALSGEEVLAIYDGLPQAVAA
jgi:hypothetical protein